MSNSENEDLVNWLEKLIDEERINNYEYSDFKNVQPIKGNVFRATWKSTDTYYALKSFDNRKLNEKVVNEIKLRKKVDLHPNILKFYGITKIETDTIHDHSLVLEYADSGTLQTYLSKHFNELDWDDKYQLALQLTSAVECMHEYGIIHHDLHANNILVHQKNIKLAGFGLPKNIDEESSNSSEMFAYTDPKSLNNQNHYELNEKSDVYSIGVLMWQISSGHQPFNERADHDLTLDIINGKREYVADGTPTEYSNLYQECWKYEPNERPDIQKVVLALKAIISHEQRDDNSLNSLEIYNFDSKSNEEIIDLNRDSILDENVNLSNFNETSVMDLENDSFESIFINTNIDKIIKKHNKGSTFEQIKQHINQQILQSNQSSNNIINWLSKNQVKLQYIWFLGLFYYHNIDVEENKENNIKSFKLFSKAAAGNFSIAQVYLAKCYSDGYGIKRNKHLSFNWYRRAAKNKSIAGQFYLGYCYEYGIGTKQNEKESIHWYRKAANSGNMTAKLYLANCYRLGKGVEKNETKAFKYYEILALQKISDAQNQLGNCFYKGIGTQKDKVKAKYWYENAANNGSIVAKENLKKRYKIQMKENNIFEILSFKKMKQYGLNYYGIKLIKNNNNKGIYYIQKAAESGDKIAQYNLGDLYKKGENTRKDERKAFKSYEESAEQGYINAKCQLGYCYDKGIGTDINKIKAFELYRTAAKHENSDAQNYLGLLYENGQGIEKNLRKAFRWYKKAEKRNNETARYNLGRCYQSGIGIEKDEIKAFGFYKSLAENNYLDALFKLGYCYFNGIGVKANKENAIELYKKAAEKGNIEAQICLGSSYENGQEIEKDLEKAFYWYNEAAKEDNENAQYNLGRCYQSGIGVEKDEIKALELYENAAEKGNIEAQICLGLLYENENELEKAFYWYNKAAKEDNNKTAQYNLGRCYQFGIGIEKNEIKAFELYKRAAEKGGIETKNGRKLLYKEFKTIEQEQLSDIKQLSGNISSAMMSAYKVAIKKLQIDIDSNDSLLLQKITNWGHKYNNYYNHPKIVEYLGISSIKDESLYLIMPFAEDGNLRNYTKNKKLSLGEKMKIAKDITMGVMFLHENNIIHENLNPKNVLIFNGEAKISNLPVLYELYKLCDKNNKDKDKDSYNENIFDNIGYIDPNLFLNKNDHNYKKNKSIDIYSLGSLLWEIMNEKVPYSQDQNMSVLELIKKIKEGYREEDYIPGIPSEYSELYKKCWNGNTSINDVYNKLLNIKY